MLAEGYIPDVASAPALMAWAWENRHQITRDCTWPEGRSPDLSRTYYVYENTVVARVCWPQPLAVRIDGRPLGFTPTVDANLIQRFDRSEMHLTTDCKQLAL